MQVQQLIIIFHAARLTNPCICGLENDEKMFTVEFVVTYVVFACLITIRYIRYSVQMISLPLYQIANIPPPRSLSSISFPMHGRHVAVYPPGTLFLAIGAFPANLPQTLARAVLPAVVIGAGMSRRATRHIDSGRAHEALHLGRDPGVTSRDRRCGGCSGVIGGFRLADDIDLMRFEDLVGPGDADAPAGEGTSEASGGGPVADFTWRSCFGVDCRLRGEGAVAELVTGGLLAILQLVLFGETGLGEAHQLIEHGEFELELDGVDHGFDGRFADVVVCEF